MSRYIRAGKEYYKIEKIRAIRLHSIETEFFIALDFDYAETRYLKSHVESKYRVYEYDIMGSMVDCIVEDMENEDVKIIDMGDIYHRAIEIFEKKKEEERRAMEEAGWRVVETEPLEKKRRKKKAEEEENE